MADTDKSSGTTPPVSGGGGEAAGVTPGAAGTSGMSGAETNDTDPGGATGPSPDPRRGG